MSFNWRDFLDEYGIDYSVGSPHGRGYVGIRCPFCGNAGTDPNRHRIGIAPDGSGWRCLRDNNHSGKSPVRLVAALLDIGEREAERICFGDKSEQGADDFENEIRAGVNQDVRDDSVAIPPPMIPPSIRSLRNEERGGRIRSIFIDYFTSKRGCSRQDAANLIYLYSLYGALTGAFRYRLVFPVIMPDGLATWTGRAIASGMEPRYKSLSPDPEKAQHDGMPQARYSIKQCLWNAAELSHSSGEMLVVCEGPFDAMRIDYYGRKAGIRATCVFGKSVSYRQSRLLSAIGSFKRRALLLDRDAYSDAEDITLNQTPFLEFIECARKDPDLMTRDEVLHLLAK